MCDSGEFELRWDLKCQVCGKGPAVDLRDPDGVIELGYDALCEKCGIELFGEDVVGDWAGTELYLKKYPDQIEVWK